MSQKWARSAIHFSDVSKISGFREIHRRDFLFRFLIFLSVYHHHLLPQDFLQTLSKASFRHTTQHTVIKALSFEIGFETCRACTAAIPYRPSLSSLRLRPQDPDSLQDPDSTVPSEVIPISLFQFFFSFDS